MQERKLLKLDAGFTDKFFDKALADNDLDLADYVHFPLPPSVEAFSEFQASPQGQSFRDGCDRIMDDIHCYIDASQLAFQSVVTSFKNKFIHYMGDDAGINFINIVLYQQGIPCLARIRQYLHEDKIPEDTKRGIVSNLLAQIDVCGPGVYKHIVDCYLQLKAAADFKAELQLFRKTQAEQLLVHAIKNIRRQIHGGMDVHYINAILNYFAPTLGIDEIDDSFIKSCNQVQLSYLFDYFNLNIHKRITPGRLVSECYDSLDVNGWVQVLMRHQSANNLQDFNDSLAELGARMQRFGCASLVVGELLLVDEDAYQVKAAKYEATAIMYRNIHKRLVDSGFLQESDWVTHELSFRGKEFSIHFSEYDTLKIAYINIDDKELPLLSYALSMIKADDNMKYSICSALSDCLPAVSEVTDYLLDYFHSYEYKAGLVTRDEVSNIIGYLNMSNLSGWKSYIGKMPASVANEFIDFILRDKYSREVIDEVTSVLSVPVSLDIKYKLVDVLIDYQGVNDELLKSGNNIAHVACMFKSSRLLKQYFEKGVDINKVDKFGHMPIHFAAMCDDVDSVEFLLEKGSVIDYLDQVGRSPLYLACQKGHLNTVNLLLKKGAAVNQMTAEGLIPLQAACDSGNLDLVEVLLRAGADPALYIDPKDAPVIKAINRKDMNMLMVLVNANASLVMKGEHMCALLEMLMDQSPVLACSMMIKLLATYKDQLLRRLNGNAYCDFDKDMIKEVVARNEKAEHSEEDIRLNKIFNQSVKLYFVQLLMTLVDDHDEKLDVPPVPASVRKSLCQYIRVHSKRISMFVTVYEKLSGSNFFSEEDAVIYSVKP